MITATDTGFTWSLLCNGVEVEAGHRPTEALALKALRQAEATMNFEGESIADELERLGL